MEILSHQTYIETGKSIPRLFMTAKQLSEYEGLTEGIIEKYFPKYPSRSYLAGTQKQP